MKLVNRERVDGTQVTIGQRVSGFGIMRSPPCVGGVAGVGGVEGVDAGTGCSGSVIL